MGWSSLSGPIVGRLLVTEQDAPDLSLTLETARAAGVHGRMMVRLVTSIFAWPQRVPGLGRRCCAATGWCSTRISFRC